MIPSPKSNNFLFLHQFTNLSVKASERTSSVTQQTCHFEETTYLPLSEQFETIQNQAKLEAKEEESQHPVQTDISRNHSK